MVIHRPPGDACGRGNLLKPHRHIPVGSEQGVGSAAHLGRSGLALGFGSAWHQTMAPLLTYTKHV